MKEVLEALGLLGNQYALIITKVPAELEEKWRNREALLLDLKSDTETPIPATEFIFIVKETANSPQSIEENLTTFIRTCPVVNYLAQREGVIAAQSVSPNLRNWIILPDLNMLDDFARQYLQASSVQKLGEHSIAGLCLFMEFPIVLCLESELPDFCEVVCSQQVNIVYLCTSPCTPASHHFNIIFIKQNSDPSCLAHPLSPPVRVNKYLDAASLDADSLFSIFRFFYKKTTLASPHRLNATKTIVHDIQLNNLSSFTFHQTYKSSSSSFPHFDQLSSNNKLKEMARIAEHIAHKTANGDGYLYSGSISHAKLLFKQQSQGINLPDTSTFKHLAFTLPDRSAAPGHANAMQNNVVQLAVYSWTQQTPVSSPLERMLVGDFKRSKLSKESNSLLETAFRQDKLEEAVRSELGKQHIQSDKLERNLILLQNLFKPLESWELRQSNLFMSEILHPCPRNKHLAKFLKPVRNNRKFHIHYIKQLQHVLNLQAYINKRTFFRSKGAFVSEKLLFFGPGVEVPRNVILGNHMDIIRAEERKKNKIFKQGIELSNDFEFEDRFAYHCKNQMAAGGPVQQRKQMIVCLVAVCDPEKVEIKELANMMSKKEWESVYVQLKHEERAVTVFSVREAMLVYPLMMIEYSDAPQHEIAD